MKKEDLEKEFEGGARKRIKLRHVFEGELIGFEPIHDQDGVPIDHLAVFHTMGPVDNPKPGAGTRKIRVSQIIGVE